MFKKAVISLFFTVFFLLSPYSFADGDQNQNFYLEYLDHWYFSKIFDNAYRKDILDLIDYIAPSVNGAMASCKGETRLHLSDCLVHQLIKSDCPEEELSDNTFSQNLLPVNGTASQLVCNQDERWKKCRTQIVVTNTLSSLSQRYSEALPESADNDSIQMIPPTFKGQNYINAVDFVTLGINHLPDDPEDLETADEVLRWFARGLSRALEILSQPVAFLELQEGLNQYPYTTKASGAYWVLEKMTTPISPSGMQQSLRQFWHTGTLLALPVSASEFDHWLHQPKTSSKASNITREIRDSHYDYLDTHLGYRQVMRSWVEYFSAGVLGFQIIALSSFFIMENLKPAQQ
ncbi:hypothetical protein [Endozoicomonas arenosclerae]|uniref:hypothetical protein n=1 Tax=Endozoicomonas arenosclerae TaxID=1633495 RepID=UPI00078484C6|nr:hypothetical protein [Endozoicomonas arenosclerae]